jgi:hypothetical protein
MTLHRRPLVRLAMAIFRLDARLGHYQIEQTARTQTGEVVDRHEVDARHDKTERTKA